MIAVSILKNKNNKHTAMFRVRCKNQIDEALHHFVPAPIESSNNETNFEQIDTIVIPNADVQNKNNSCNQHNSTIVQFNIEKNVTDNTTFLNDPLLPNNETNFEQIDTETQVQQTVIENNLNSDNNHSNNVTNLEQIDTIVISNADVNNKDNFNNQDNSTTVQLNIEQNVTDLTTFLNQQQNGNDDFSTAPDNNEIISNHENNLTDLPVDSQNNDVDNIVRSTELINYSMPNENELDGENNIDNNSTILQFEIAEQSSFNEDEDPSFDEEFDPDCSSDDNYSDVIELDTKPSLARFKRETDAVLENEKTETKQQKIDNDGVRKRISYENQYMLTDIQHKSRHGWYEASVLLPDITGTDRFTYDDSTFPLPESKKFDEPIPNIIEDVPITCVVCFGENHNEDDFFAIYTKCLGKKHPFCHTCFNQKCCKNFSYSSTKPPDRIELFDGCTICKVNNGEWRNAKYSPSLRRWRLGKILPDNIIILAYHQKMWKPQIIDINDVQYNNYIVDGFLLNALFKNIGIVNKTIQDKYPISEVDYKYLIEEYEAKNETFHCKRCDKKKKQINQCELKKCKFGCDYTFCRDCFLDRITTEIHSSPYNYKNGLLCCPDCNKTSRAIFCVDGQYLSSENKNKLMQQK
jgi:hypothetical protein